MSELLLFADAEDDRHALRVVVSPFVFEELCLSGVRFVASVVVDKPLEAGERITERKARLEDE